VLKGLAMPDVSRSVPPQAGARVTMKDVAAALGVSTATVSRALQDDPAISSATKSAVLEVAQRVQYRPSAAARRLRTQSASLVGVVVQSVGDGYVGDVVLGIQGRARKFGYQPLFFAAEGRPDLESEALDVFLSEHVTQLIAVSPTGKPQLLRRAVAEGMHVAVINGDPSVPARRFTEMATGTTDDQAAGIDGLRRSPICHIRFDDAGAGRLATEHLIGLDHSAFVHLRGPNVRSGLLRLLGYRQALTAAGLWPQAVLCPQAPVMQSREDAVGRYLRDATPPVAMVAYDDMCAVAALRAAHQAGWRVPEDLSVVGIDDIQFASYTNPGLTTVAQPKHELGALAVDALLADGGADSRPRVLDGQLVIRESTLARPATAGRAASAELPDGLARAATVGRAASAGLPDGLAGLDLELPL
jgi:DNA-binding LacI/PurR family transcriptional regulator